MILVTAFLLLFVAAGQSAVTVHRTLQIEDGLVQSQVNAVLEDSRGFVWFGTFGGVSRWDGVNFRNFQLQDGLSGLDVRAFHETSDGTILIAMSGTGLAAYRGGVITTVGEELGLPELSVSAIHRTHDGSLYIATGDGLVIFTDETLDPKTARRELQGIRVSGFSPRRDGGLYMSTFGDGVLIYQDGVVTPLDAEGVLPGDIIRDVLETENGDLYISVYRGGVWLYDNGTLQPFEHGSAIQGHDVKQFMQTRDGALYMATIDGGIGILRDDRLEVLTTAEGLASNTVWAVHEGSSGTIYMGTWGGVNLYQPGRFTNYNTATGLLDDIVNATAELPDGSIAVGTISGGVSFLRRGEVLRTLTRDDGLEHSRVWSLLSARDGSLFIGTHAGLNRWRDGELSTVYRETESPSGRVYAMHEADDGTIYLATYGGILVLRDGELTPLYDEPDPGRSTVVTVQGTRDGALWFGTNIGVVKFQNGSVSTPDSVPLLSTTKIWAIHEGRDGTLYFGTDGEGLLISRDGMKTETPLEIFDVEDGLSENSVLGIVEDESGRLYLSTHRGVTIWDQSFSPPLVRQIHTVDGLASEECNQGGAFVDSRGRLWFGTIHGVTCYDPRFDPPVATPPQVHMMRTRLFEDDLPLASFGETSFGHRENFFKFDFIATNPASPGDVVYKFRLSGIDHDWVEDRRTMVQYTALPPDDYEFSVMAGNEWGVWSEPTVLPFHIDPPWWSTWWFRALVVLAIAGLVTLIVRARVRRLLAFEQLRTKIAADLHDDIGAGLTEIAITSHVLEQKLSEDQREQVRGELDRLGFASRRLVQGMSDIVWLVNPQRDSLDDLLARLGDANRALFEAAGVDFRVEGLEALNEVRLGMERRQHLYLIFKEAINNGLKYSQCREMRLSARVSGGTMELSLRDDGIGFDSDAKGGGNGLTNMQRRVEKLGGTLQIVSAPGEGTVITLKA